MILFAPPESIYNTMQERHLEEATKLRFESKHKVESLNFYQSKDNNELFNLVCDCEILVLMPDYDGSISPRTEWILTACVILKKECYLITGNGSIVKGKPIGKGQKCLTNS